MKKIYVVGIGPGEYEQMTIRAVKALESCDVIIGYTVYVDLVREHFAGKGIDALYCAGELSAKIAEAVVTVSKRTEVHYYKEKEQLLENLMKEVKIGDTILVKASHFMGFSEIVKELIQ